MLFQIFSWTGVSEYQKLNLYAPAIADKFLIEMHMNKLIWRNLWMMLFGKRWQAKYLHDMLQYFVEVFENLKNFMQNPNSYDWRKRNYFEYCLAGEYMLCDVW